MARGSLNVLPVITRWWAQDGRARWSWYIVLPLTVVVAIVAMGLEADNLGALMTGSLFLTGALLNIMFQVFGWTSQAAEDIEATPSTVGASVVRRKYQRRLVAIRRLYDSLTWATLVSLGLSVALIVLNTESPESQARGDLVLTTAVVGGLGSHLLVNLLVVVNRLFTITRATVDSHSRRIDAA